MGGKSSGGRSADALDQTIYNQFYDQAYAGGNINYSTLPADRQEAAILGAQAGAAARPVSFEMPDYGSIFGELQAQEAQAQADYEATIAANEAAEKAAQEAAEREAGENRVKQLYASKFAAANQATDLVNQQIEQELGYANTGGADYTITEEQKAERINNAFANYWSEEQESELAGLEETWGSAGNRWTSGIVRGVESGDGASDSGEGAQAGSPVAPGAVFSIGEDEEEDGLLGGTSLALGSV